MLDNTYPWSEKSKFAIDYKRDGFAVLENFLNDSEIEILKKESLRLIQEEAVKEKSKNIFGDTVSAASNYFITSGDKVRFFYEKDAFDPKTKSLVVPLEQSVNKIAHALHYHNKAFKDITFSKKTMKILLALNYEDPVVLQSMVIFKNPKIGSEVGCHQDSTYLSTEPETLIGFWIALDDADEENGCLEFIPGSHRDGYSQRWVRTGNKNGKLLKFIGDAKEWDESKLVKVPVKKGTLVMIHGSVVHRSGPNKSDRPRWIYTFHLYDNCFSNWMEGNWLQVGEYPSFMSAVMHFDHD